MTPALVVALPEAAKRTSEGGKAGPIGLAVILILCIVCYFLFKSMSKHLKKVRDEFPSDAATGPRAAPAARVVLVKTRPTDHPDLAADPGPGPGPGPGGPPPAVPMVDDPENRGTRPSD